jgi:transcriptional regulator with XRE-family HTH domain
MLNKEYRDAFVAAQNSNTIAAQISAMRHARGWTQGQLAEKCGMRQPRISALEDPDFENVEIVTLQRLASAFDVGLNVSFVTFSEIARRSTSMKNSSFNVSEFSKDALTENIQDYSMTSREIRIQFSPSSGEYSRVSRLPIIESADSNPVDITIPPPTGLNPHELMQVGHG